MCISQNMFFLNIYIPHRHCPMDFSPNCWQIVSNIFGYQFVSKNLYKYIRIFIHVKMSHSGLEPVPRVPYPFKYSVISTVLHVSLMMFFWFVRSKSFRGHVTLCRVGFSSVFLSPSSCCCCCRGGVGIRSLRMAVFIKKRCQIISLGVLKVEHDADHRNYKQFGHRSHQTVKGQ